jgi:2-polyprenyl-6-methoxyphenol hydroxylase-like FAD-dependent oxidoreductase
VYNLLRSAEPASPIVGYRRTENCWRHYERLPRQPEGFIVLGDAACAFNPVYGQGMTTAAQQALALDQCLRRRGTNVQSKEIQKHIAGIVATPWALATGEDLRYPGVGARPGFVDKVLQHYVHRVMKVSTHDPQARQPLLEVFTMLAPPRLLLRPDVVARVVRDAMLAPQAEAPADLASDQGV